MLARRGTAIGAWWWHGADDASVMKPSVRHHAIDRGFNSPVACFNRRSIGIMIHTSFIYNESTLFSMRIHIYIIYIHASTMENHVSSIVIQVISVHTHS